MNISTNIGCWWGTGQSRKEAADEEVDEEQKNKKEGEKKREGRACLSLVE